MRDQDWEDIRKAVKAGTITDQAAALRAVMVGGKNRLLAGTSAHLCMAARTFAGITKPISRISLFTTADGRLAAITRDAIDKGLPQAAGIPIIDGDKVEEPVEPAAP
jgi:hypothetical protein